MKAIVAAIIGMLMITPLVAAQELDVNAGVLPDSPLYGLDKLFEGLQLALTFGNVGKADLKYRIAEERLAEAEALDNPDLAESTLEEYESELDEVNTDVENAVATGAD